MNNEIGIKPSEDLAYWVGVVQSDGYLDKYHDKKRKRFYHRISVDVSKKSLSMLEKFLNISKMTFGSNIRIYECKNEVFKCTLGTQRLEKFFDKLDIQISDPPNPPSWTLNCAKFFGAYLAGIIDGDGTINISRKDSKGRIRIFSKGEQKKLIEYIQRILNCSANTRFYKGCYHLEFKISSKNYKFLKKFVLPCLAIMNKSEKLENFIHDKFEQNIS